LALIIGPEFRAILKFPEKGYCLLLISQSDRTAFGEGAVKDNKADYL